MTDYYDELLASIIVCLLAGVGIGLFTPVALHLGVLGGALAAMAFVLDGLFGHPPLPGTDPRGNPPGTVPRPRSRSTR